MLLFVALTMRISITIIIVLIVIVIIIVGAFLCLGSVLWRWSSGAALRCCSSVWLCGDPRLFVIQTQSPCTAGGLHA